MIGQRYSMEVPSDRARGGPDSASLRRVECTLRRSSELSVMLPTACRRDMQRTSSGKWLYIEVQTTGRERLHAGIARR